MSVTFPVLIVHAVNGDGTVDLLAGVDPDSGADVILTGVLCSSGYPHRSPGDAVVVMSGPAGNLVMVQTPMLTGWSGTDITNPDPLE